MHKRNLIIIIVLILLLSIFTGWRVYQKISEKSLSGNSSGSPRNLSVPVEVEPIIMTDLFERDTFNGTMIARANLNISSKVSGQLKQLKVDIGDKVFKGDVVAYIDDISYQQNLVKAVSALVVAEANELQANDAYRIAQNDLSKQQLFLKQNFISQAEFDHFYSQYITAKTRRDAAKANVASAKAVLVTAEKDLNECRVIADWNSDEKYRFVGEKFVDEGIIINRGQPIISLIDISSLVIVIHVSELNYPKVSIGQNAFVQSDSYPSRYFAGNVARIAPFLQEATRQARVEIEVDNPDNLLRPGMYSRIVLNYNEKYNVKAVPIRALYRHNNELGLFFLAEDRNSVSFIPVDTGIQSGDYIQLINPVLEGYVVTIGQDLLADGRSVNVLNLENK